MSRSGQNHPGRSYASRESEYCPKEHNRRGESSPGGDRHSDPVPPTSASQSPLVKFPTTSRRKSSIKISSLLNPPNSDSNSPKGTNSFSHLLNNGPQGDSIGLHGPPTSSPAHSFSPGAAFSVNLLNPNSPNYYHHHQYHSQYPEQHNQRQRPYQSAPYPQASSEGSGFHAACPVPPDVSSSPAPISPIDTANPAPITPVAPRKYTCETCGKRYMTVAHLTRHEMIHTGAKPYECPYPGCGLRFLRSDNCTQHYKTHNNPRGKTTRRMKKMNPGRPEGGPSRSGGS